MEDMLYEVEPVRRFVGFPLRLSEAQPLAGRDDDHCTFGTRLDSRATNVGCPHE